MHRSLGFSSTNGGTSPRSNAVATSTGGGLASGLAGGLQRGKTTVPPLNTRKIKAPRGGKLAPLNSVRKAITDEQREAAKFQFDAYDTNSNGKIDREELKNILG